MTQNFSSVPCTMWGKGWCIQFRGPGRCHAGAMWWLEGGCRYGGGTATSTLKAAVCECDPESLLFLSRHLPANVYPSATMLEGPLLATLSVILESSQSGS